MTKPETRHRLWINGNWEDSTERVKLHSPFDGKPCGEVAWATPEQMRRALTAAGDSFFRFRRSSRIARSRLCALISQGISDRRKDLVDRMVHEAGKPCTLADVEVSRAVQTFALAAEESKRFGGEVVPLDVDTSSRAFAPAISLFFPRGPVFGITPFNFPLNLVAHKVAPALAVGAPIIIKPAPQAPGAAVILASIFEDALSSMAELKDEIPSAALQVVSCSNEVAALAVQSPAIAVLSFTGSASVGWMLQKMATGKKVALELGGNAAVIVHKDADLERAAARSAFGAFAYSGQVCISVQRILVHKDIADQFEQRLKELAKKTVAGDPSGPKTIVGPIIDDRAADRIMNWIDSAKKTGGQVISGGARNGRVIEPTILKNVRSSEQLVCEEAFGPVVVIDTYSDFDDAVKSVNASKYGLQAGVFTDSARLIDTAVRDLDVGGVIINDIPTFRADNMPYGGMKESGLGREGVRYAMEEYCERKTVVRWTGNL